MNIGKCKGCGREILWAKSSKGFSIPLDPNIVVYSVVDGIAVKVPPSLIGEKFYVSHFSTCPNADDFSGKNKSSFVDPQHRDFNEPKEVEPPI